MCMRSPQYFFRHLYVALQDFQAGELGLKMVPVDLGEVGSLLLPAWGIPGPRVISYMNEETCSEDKKCLDSVARAG